MFGPGFFGGCGGGGFLFPLFLLFLVGDRPFGGGCGCRSRRGFGRCRRPYY